jgi:hypothetical protein
MPYITPYFTPIEFEAIERYCEKVGITRYELAKTATLEKIKKK